MLTVAHSYSATEGINSMRISFILVPLLKEFTIRQRKGKIKKQRKEKGKGWPGMLAHQGYRLKKKKTQKKNPNKISRFFPQPSAYQEEIHVYSVL